jgi:hypothetical protein
MTRDLRFRAPFPVAAAWPVALLVAAVSFGGLLSDAYPHETAAWAAQARGQDWFDLLVVAPWLAICGVGARSSARWRVLLAGGYAYAVYELLVYAFAIHFSHLFLIYCATLGLAAFALIGLAASLREDPVPIDRTGARLGGAFLIAVGSAFALRWLAEDVPAVLAGQTPRALVATGLVTNPVHVIDLAFVLPAFIVVGALLWQQRRAGEVFGPVLLAFAILMAASIGGSLLAVAIAGGTAAVPAIVAMFALGAASAVVLARASRGTGGRSVMYTVEP